MIAALSGLIILLGIAAGRYLESNDLSLAIERQRNETLQEASVLRTRIEAEINSTFYLITGLTSYIELHPELTQEQFEDFVKPMLRAKPNLNNIAAAPDLVISYVYPREGNEAAIGLDYRANESQREAALRVIRSEAPVIAGPLTLVQGGQAIIGRFPVFTNQQGKRRLWGLISTPLAMDFLYKAAGLDNPRLPIACALRGKDGLGALGECFYGDPQLFEQDAITLPIQLISGEWLLAAKPVDGWTKAAPNALRIRLSVVLISLLALSTLILFYVYLESVERRRESESSASQAKSRFLANLSHEIRTPLNGVIGIADILQSTPLDAQQRNMADLIVKAGNSLLNLLNDILDLSKIDSGHLTVECSPVALRPLLEDLLAPYRIQAQNRGISLELDLSQCDVDLLSTDETRLRQILRNLLSNALKFTKEGQVKMSIARVKERIQFAIADTGIGIAPDRIESVFNEFEQEDSSISRKFGGTGLGLAIARKLAMELGGTLTATSKKGYGSVFTLTLHAN